MRTLVDLGYVRQEPSRQYSLGPRLMRLAESSTKLVGTIATPYMSTVVDALGESVNLAVLDGDEIVYVAQVQPSNNFMRMFTEVGRRTMPHTTAVGKAILADRTERDVRALLQRTGMPRRTEHTITSPDEFVADLEQTRKQGYAIDDGEQEVGVRCVAVAVPGAPRPMALSMSGPLTRMRRGHGRAGGADAARSGAPDRRRTRRPRLARQRQRDRRLSACLFRLSAGLSVPTEMILDMA